MRQCGGAGWHSLRPHFGAGRDDHRGCRLLGHSPYVCRNAGQGTPLLAYPPETAVAEKFQVMLFRAESNSRMKDFHDIWWMSAHLPFDGRSLSEAITATCARRRTELPAQPTVLTRQFATSQSKQAQWSTFRGRLVGSSCPTEFEAVMEQLRRFLGPVVAALRSHEKLILAWDPVHGWTDV
ncbi:MAG: nucleotidyl transferase AbiEii/AbiGii toxin family protein [Phycisphaerales bacterium]|nr:nucleotidyl transferase AbiEii/AbiGii toxin family protein [Phycisphaerales bacterium]